MQTGLKHIIDSTDSRIAGSRLLRLLSSSKKNKMHTMHFLAFPYGKYLISSMTGLGTEQRAAYLQLLHAFNCIQQKQFTAAELAEAEGELVLAVGMVEAFLPVNELDLKLISLLDLPRKVRNTGPLSGTSMFVYEGIWATVVDWATNKAAPEVTLICSFADYELAVFAYWSDPSSFCVPAISKFTVEYAMEMSLRYQIPAKPLHQTLVTVKLKGAALPNFTAGANVQLRMAVHRFYMAADDRYARAFNQYMDTYLTSMSSKDRRSYRVQCNGNSSSIESKWSYSAACLQHILSNWKHWAKQQQQQQQQTIARGRPRTSPHQQLSTADLSTHLLISPMTSDFTYNLYPEVIVGSARFVHPAHARAKEFGWALMRQWNDDSNTMSFMKVLGIVSHRDYAGTLHELLYGQFHSSALHRRAQQMHTSTPADVAVAGNTCARLDPLIGMPVISVNPDMERGMEVIHCVACNQVADLNVSIVQHLIDSQLLVALRRDPGSLYRAAGLPMPA